MNNNIIIDEEHWTIDYKEIVLRHKHNYVHKYGINSGGMEHNHNKPHFHPFYLVSTAKGYEIVHPPLTDDI